MRVVEHRFRPRRPAWIWAVVVADLAFGLALGYFLGWFFAFPALLAVGILAVRTQEVRLERDERSVAHLVAGRKSATSVDLSRLTAVVYEGGGYEVTDETGAQLLASFDERLVAEVREAAGRRRLALDRDTEAALIGGVRGQSPRRRMLGPVGASVALPALMVGLLILNGGGIELDRHNDVDVSELTAVNAVAGAVANPFSSGEPRELYLVALDAKSQRRLPGLAVVLQARFGMTPELTAPLKVDAGVLDRSRKQLDGWKITARLLDAHQQAHPGRPVVVIAVTRLDTFNPERPDDRFAFLTSGASDGNVTCGGVISTARFDVWPGSEEKRLAKMGSRLLARCLYIHEDISIRSIADVDRLDDRAGADSATIAQRVAERRALPRAPSS